MVKLSPRICLPVLLFAAGFGCAAAEDPLPKFHELYRLLSTNLPAESPAELENAAIRGLVGQVQAQLITAGAPSNAPAGPPATPAAKATVFDEAYAYVRLARIETNSAEKFSSAYETLARSTKSKIQGVVLDLRSGEGTNYEAAAAVADRFLSSSRPLLSWEGGAAGATAKTNAITLPLAILVNGGTAGAAEALAAALRESGTGLVIGANTAGRAATFREFPLWEGTKLRIASDPVKLGDGTPLDHPLKPDIAVETDPADEKIWLDDPYKNLHPAEPVTGDSPLARAGRVNRHAMNEAELVREHRAGELSDGEPDAGATNGAGQIPAAPVLADPVLARALDLLKGLAVLQQGRPPG